MVSLQKYGRKAWRQPAYQPAYHAFGIAAAIDIVAEKDELGASWDACFAVALDEIQNAVQKVSRP